MKNLLETVFDNKTVQKVGQIQVLVVGVGGIGCQVLKNLSKSGVKNITLVDFDFIDSTNLNRQFYFHKQHIGLRKVQVARNEILKIDHTLSIQCHVQSIYDQSTLDYEFYNKFDILISALDSIKARSQLSKIAIRHNLPLIDAGTMGYNGQVYSSSRFMTNCHNCNALVSQNQQYAACTIRSRPQQCIHIVIYATHFYESFFASSSQKPQFNYTLNQKWRYANYIKKEISLYEKIDLERIIQEIFEQMFNIGIKSRDEQGHNMYYIKKIPYIQAINSQMKVYNHNKKQQLRQLDQYEQLLSLSQYTKMFTSSFMKLLWRKNSEKAPINFDKDDDDCMRLVCSIINLRTCNYLDNSNNKHNKLKYMSYYECKDLAGKIIPAIASTNAIAASLQVRDLLLLVQGKKDKWKYMSIRPYGDQKITSSFLNKPNINCQYCSQKILYFNINCNIYERTYGELYDYLLKNCYSYGRQLMHGAYTIFKKDLNTKKPVNEFKILAYNKKYVSKNKTINLSMLPIRNQTPLTINLMIVHNEKKQYFKAYETGSQNKVIELIQRYYQKIHKNRSELENYYIKVYGQE